MRRRILFFSKAMVAIEMPAPTVITTPPGVITLIVAAFAEGAARMEIGGLRFIVTSHAAATATPSHQHPGPTPRCLAMVVTEIRCAAARSGVTKVYLDLVSGNSAGSTSSFKGVSSASARAPMLSIDTFRSPRSTSLT